MTEECKEDVKNGGTQKRDRCAESILMLSESDLRGVITCELQPEEWLSVISDDTSTQEGGYIAKTIRLSEA